MRRRWKTLLLAACGLIAVVAVCFFVCLQEKEPSYNGRTLSEWLWIGVKVPEYKQSVARPDLQPGRRCRPQNWNQCHSILLKWNERSDLSKRAMALEGFAYLTRMLRAHCLTLTNRFLSATKAEDIYHLGREIGLLGIARARFPVADSQINPPNVRAYAARGGLAEMSYLGSNADVIVSALLEIANDSQNSNIVVGAESALGQLGRSADKVVPIARAEYSLPRSTTKAKYAFSALFMFGTNAIAAKPAVESLLSDRNEENQKVGNEYPGAITPRNYVVTNGKLSVVQ